MIRMSVFYPRTDGATFDLDYFRDQHMALVLDILKPDAANVDQGIKGPYVASAHMTFPDMAALQAALASERAGEMQADMANYTSISPTVQISEIVS